jgi:hypothetical protein
MKKTILFSLLIFFSAAAVNAQLTDTKWRNTMNIPDPYETILHFKKDTVVLTIAADGSLIETMNFIVSKDTLKLLKLSGMSPCADNITGLYKIEIKDDKMTIVPISDDCSERANAFKPEPWIKEKG